MVVPKGVVFSKPWLDMSEVIYIYIFIYTIILFLGTSYEEYNLFSEQPVMQE